MHDVYADFAALRAAEPADAFSISLCDRGSHVAVAAPHGGGIEPGTSEIALAIAGTDLSYYLFEGQKRTGNSALHITSRRFDEPHGLAVLRRAARVLTVHGERSDEETVFLGGLDRSLRRGVATALARAGYAVAEPPSASLDGRDARNLCNAGRTGAGVQLELPAGLRRSFFESLSRAGRAKPTARLTEFAGLVRAAALACGRSEPAATH